MCDVGSKRYLVHSHPDQRHLRFSVQQASSILPTVSPHSTPRLSRLVCPTEGPPPLTLLGALDTHAHAHTGGMRDPLVPINAQEDPKGGAADAGSEKQALCISIATLILSIPALIGA